MVTYSARAAMALGYLKRAYNDIEIFVEDTASQNMWVRILSTLLPKRTKISSVNMLGGRENVVKACRLDQKKDGRRRIYIIDGDFDFLRRLKKPNLKHLYRLRSYCVENLLINEKSLIEIAFDCDGKLSRKEAANKLDYRGIIGANEGLLKSLFVIYATAAQLNSRLKTVSFSVRQLLDSTSATIRISPDKVRKRARKLLRDLCRENSVSDVRMTRKEIITNAHSIPTGMAVSGKDYLLPVIHLHLARVCGYRGSPEQLKALLAREFTSVAEPYLARRLRQLAA